MPFVENPDLENFDNGDDMPIPHIGTDLFDNLSSDEEALDSGPVLPAILQAETVETVVRLDEEPDVEGEQGNGADEEESDDDDEDIPKMEVNAPKKRGRPSRSASRASTPKPKPTKSTKSGKATGGRKRKAEESADEPVAKRSGSGRATAASASDAIKQSSTRRPRAAPGTAKAAPKATGAKRGPKPKKTEEYEVEKIMEHLGSGRSIQYRVKWKGYNDSENTWEPKSNLAHAPELVKEYEATIKKEKKEAAPAKKKPGPVKKAAASAKKAASSDKKPAGRRGRPKKT